MRGHTVSHRAGFRAVPCDAAPESFAHRCPFPQPPVDSHAYDGPFFEHWPVTAPFALCAGTAHQYASALQAGGAASAIARSSFLIDTAAAMGGDHHAVVLRHVSAFRSLFLMGAVDEGAVSGAGSVALRCVSESVGTAADWALIAAVADGMASFSMFDFPPGPGVGRLVCLSGLPTATLTPTIVIKSHTRAAVRPPTLSLSLLPTLTLQPNATLSWARKPSATLTAPFSASLPTSSQLLNATPSMVTTPSVSQPPTATLSAAVPLTGSNTQTPVEVTLSPPKCGDPSRKPSLLPPRVATMPQSPRAL